VLQSGFNYRLSDVNCALGLGQLKKIDKFLNYRKKIFNIYKAEFKKIINKITIPFYKKSKASYHLFLISINFKKIKSSKDKFLKFLRKNNIFCQYHYIPIYRFKLFNEKINLNSYKGAEFYYKNTVSLPIFYDLKVSSQKTIINKIKFFLNK
jgi:dTDP-4-amino-4,6-dideoxygalactose transaminase